MKQRNFHWNHLNYFLLWNKSSDYFAHIPAPHCVWSIAWLQVQTSSFSLEKCENYLVRKRIWNLLAFNAEKNILNERAKRNLYAHKIQLRVGYGIFLCEMCTVHKLLWCKHVRAIHTYTLTNILIYDRNSFHFRSIAVDFAFVPFRLLSDPVLCKMNSAHFKAYDSCRLWAKRQQFQPFWGVYCQMDGGKRSYRKCAIWFRHDNTPSLPNGTQ